MKQALGRLSALDAAMQAGRAAIPGRCESIKTASPSNAPQASFTDVASLSLLWRIRRRVGETAFPAIQFVSCDGNARAGDIAASAARASAALWGRTLLVDAHRASEREPAPDAYIARLYHQNLNGTALCARLSNPTNGLSPSGDGFRAIFISQISPTIGDGACATGSLCSGTIMVVRAGRSNLRQILMTKQKIQEAGGLIVGTVMVRDQV